MFTAVTFNRVNSQWGNWGSFTFCTRTTVWSWWIGSDCLEWIGANFGLASIWGTKKMSI